jgi:hypothetical protein
VQAFGAHQRHTTGHYILLKLLLLMLLLCCLQEESKLLVATPAKFKKWFNVDVLDNTEVISIDRQVCRCCSNSSSSSDSCSRCTARISLETEQQQLQQRQQFMLHRNTYLLTFRQHRHASLLHTLASTTTRH